MDAIKNASGKLEVTIQKDAPAPEVVTYDYDFLVAQRARIVADANAYLEARTKELADVDTLLAKCTELGIGAAQLPDPI